MRNCIKALGRTTTLDRFRLTDVWIALDEIGVSTNRSQGTVSLDERRYEQFTGMARTY